MIPYKILKYKCFIRVLFLYFYAEFYKHIFIKRYQIVSIYMFSVLYVCHILLNIYCLMHDTLVFMN